MAGKSIEIPLKMGEIIELGMFQQAMLDYQELTMDVTVFIIQSR